MSGGELLLLQAASRYRAAEWAIRCNEDAIRDEAHNARVEEWRAADAALAALLGESSPFRPTPAKHRRERDTVTTVETPGADDADLDEFTAKNAWAMRSRLAHGAAKFGALSWREESYSDSDNLARLDRAVGHLSAALGQYRLGTVDEDEVRKRAADVANQAFMLADPARAVPASKGA